LAVTTANLRAVWEDYALSKDASNSSQYDEIKESARSVSGAPVAIWAPLSGSPLGTASTFLSQ
jgi:hypothetical protein